ncbi:hypothetical protein Tco_0495657 [Tanacetum coccineum]
MKYRPQDIQHTAGYPIWGVTDRSSRAKHHDSASICGYLTLPSTTDSEPEGILGAYEEISDIFLSEEKSLPHVVSTYAESLGYVVDRIQKRIQRKGEDEEDKEDHIDTSRIHPAIVVPTVKLVSPPEGTEPVIPPPTTDITTTRTRITVRL